MPAATQLAGVALHLAGQEVVELLVRSSAAARASPGSAIAAVERQHHVRGSRRGARGGRRSPRRTESLGVDADADHPGTLATCPLDQRRQQLRSIRRAIERHVVHHDLLAVGPQPQPADDVVTVDDFDPRRGVRRPLDDLLGLGVRVVRIDETGGDASRGRPRHGRGRTVGIGANLAELEHVAMLVLLVRQDVCGTSR